MQKKYRMILQKFAEKVRGEYPLARIWAFGSYTRDTATSESDLDTCIVLPRMQENDRFAISDIAWEVGFEHELHISTIVVSEKDFEQGPVSASPLLNAVRSEGVAA